MTQRGDSIEVPYGWVIVFGSVAIHAIGLGSPIILWVALKPIAADFDWPRAVPSLAYSLMMIGAGTGGIAMGWWMDKKGILSPVLFGSVMIGVAHWSPVNPRGDGAFTSPMACSSDSWASPRYSLP